MAKLVRDRLPEKFSLDFYLADGREYARRLREKLVEETQEFVEDPSVEELADVLEVVYALRDELGVSEQQLEKARLEKRRERGGFARGAVWTGD